VERLLYGAPPGTKAIASGKHRNAWMMIELFLATLTTLKGKCAMLS